MAINTRTVQVPVGVKLEVTNQATTMKNLLNDLQETFSSVDINSSLGKKLEKSYAAISKKLGSMDNLLARDSFSEGDLSKVATMAESIYSTFGEINRLVNTTNVKNLGIKQSDLERLEQAEKILSDLYSKKASERFAAAGGLLKKRGGDDLKRFTSRQKETGFDSGRSYEANERILAKTAARLEGNLENLSGALSEAENAVTGFNQILSDAKVKKNLAEGQLNAARQRRAELQKQTEKYQVSQAFAAIKGTYAGRGKADVIQDYQELLQQQLTKAGNFKKDGASFTKIFAELIQLSPEEISTLAEQPATQIVDTLKQKLSEKMSAKGGLNINFFKQKAASLIPVDQADILKADTELLQAQEIYDAAGRDLTDKQKELNNAIAQRNDAENNLKQAQDLLEEVKAQLQQLNSIRQEYEEAINATYKQSIDQATENRDNIVKSIRQPILDRTEQLVQNAGATSKNTNQLSTDVYNQDQANARHTQEAEDFTRQLQEATRHWMSASQIISYIKDGIRQAWQDIQGLDKAMTNIAVVTDMSVSDLWGKINEYMTIAQQYGVTTQGVYEVSQLYYQQGLSTNEVMAATTETLKLARIAGMDYADAADAMTVAIRSFKMEMSDAQRITDVYSKVAAITASDSEELAIAMSKTASSAESVGSSFENTTAMLAVMVETTRESAQNLGSALKSIISRYGEMKVGLTVDSEGEALDYNKVDTALKSIGISIKDAQGQFRDFDDVIFELSSQWDSLDKNTQRYIATIMAGNRQQSRFIALVDNWERLDEVSKAAEDADDAGLLQYAKTLDSLETKINTVSNSFQQFYMSAFNGDFFKGVLDVINNIITSLSKVGPLLGGIQLIQLITQIKNIGSLILNGLSGGIGKIKSASEAWKNEFTNAGWAPVGEQIGQIIANGIASKAAYAVQQTINDAKAQALIQSNNPQETDNLVKDFASSDLRLAGKIYNKKDTATPEEQQAAQQIIDAHDKLQASMSSAEESVRKAAIIQYENSVKSAREILDGSKKAGEAVEKSGKNFWEKAKEFGKQHSQGIRTAGKGLYAVGTMASMYGMTMDQTDYDSYVKSNWVQGIGSAATGLGQILTGDKIGGVITLITGAVTAIKRISQLDEVRLESLTKKANEANIERAEKREEARNLESTIDNLRKLQAARYKSEEAEQAFIEASNTAAEQFPGLIQGYDDAGNAIIDVITNATEAEQLLIQARQKAAEATLKASAAEYQKNIEEEKQANEAAEDLIGALYSMKVFSEPARKYKMSDVEWLLKTAQVNTRDKNGLINTGLGLTDTDVALTGFDAVFRAIDILETLDSEYFFKSDSQAGKEVFYKLLRDSASGVKIDGFDAETDIGKQDIRQAYEWASSGAINQAQSTTKASRKAYIQGVINDDLINQEILQEHTRWKDLANFEKIIVDNIYDEIIQDVNNFDKTTGLLTFDGQTNIENLVSSYATAANSAFQNGLGLENFNEFIESIETGKISHTEAAAKFTELLATANNESRELIQKYETYYLEALKEGNISFGNYLENISGTWKGLGLENIASQYYDEISTYAEAVRDKISSGAITSDEGDELISSFIALYESLEGFSEARDALFAAITDGSIFTTSGQAVLEQKLKELTDGTVNTVEIPVYAENLITAYAQLEQIVADGLQTLIETIDGAIDGVDITKATAISQKTGQSINDLFNYSDGKYSIKDSKAFKAIAEAYYSEIDAQITATGEETTRQLKLLQGYENKEISQGHEDYLEAEQLYNRLEPLAKAANLTVQQYLEKVQNDSVDALIAQKDAWTKETQLALDIRDLTRGERTEYGVQAAQILASTGGLGLSEEDVKTVALALGKDIEWIKDQLILNSDGTFDIKNLGGLNLSSIGQDAANSTMVKRAVEESNLADAVEDSLVGMYDNIAEVSLEDLTSLYKDIKKKDVDKNTLTKYQDALAAAQNGSYIQLISIVDTLRQEVEDAGINVDTSLIDATIRDAQLAIIASVLSVLDSGLQGDLGFVEYNEFLKNTLKIDASKGSEEWARWQKYVYETNDGLKFTNAGISAIYTELGKIAPMAQQAFIETVADGQKQYETLGSTLEYIEELEENINKANSEADDTKLKQYEAELEIAQKIFEIRSEDPDQFNFMSRDIRDGIQAPTNMWENAGQAAEVLRQATADGYMAAEDFWRMAETTNEYLSLSGKEFTLGMNSYAEAMEEAAKHTKVVGDELVIDFGAMGLNIETAMGDMASGLDEGIKAMAEEQIKLLDAQISMLEGFQALEELSDEEIFADGIEVGELFNKDELTVEGKSFVDQIKEILQQILGEDFSGDEFDAMLKGNQQLATDFLNSWMEFLATGETSPQAMEAFVRKWMLDYSEAYKNEVPNVFEDTATVPESEYTSFYETRGTVLKPERVEEEVLGEVLNENQDIETTDTTVLTNISNDVSSIAAIMEAQKGKELSPAEEKGITPYEVGEGLKTQALARISAEKEALYTEAEKEQEQINRAAERRQEGAYLQAEARRIAEEKRKAEERKIAEIQRRKSLETEDDSLLSAKDLQDLAEIRARELAEAKKLAAEKYASEDEAYWDAMRADLDAEQQAKADSYREFGAEYKYEKIRQEAAQLLHVLRDLSGAADDSSTALAEWAWQEEDLKLDAVLDTAPPEYRAKALEAAREEAELYIEDFKLLHDIPDEPVDVQVDYSEVNEASSAVDSLLSKDNSTVDLTINVKQNGSTNVRGGVEAAMKPKYTVKAKGNVALAGGRGTLMGELGPELYVQNGHYYIAGAHGAEFVDLADDAIVFNHLQTRRIMGAGSINGRGTPVVSESRSVSFATGNADGRAMAIGDIINKLKQQKAMWQSIIDSMSITDMVGGGGDSGGGGGGGSGNSIKAVTEELQEWYNLSRQIADIEQEINNIIAERENIADGGEYLKSLREQQKLLREQSATQEVLLRYQQLQLQRQADFINQNRIWSKFLTVDENGLLQYIEGNETNGGKGALKVLQELNDMSGEQQLAFLQNLGYSYTDNDGNALEGEDLIQMFFEELQSQIDQYDSLYDTVHETEETLEDLEASIEDINEEIKQNQMDLEEAIYDIIVDAWEAEISQMEKQADLIKEANEKYIDGLNEALSNERDMYQDNDNIADREQLQRRLALLRRSGGSASEIADLEQQLDEMLRDEYFNKQEQMIESIQSANEEQVRLLEEQITIQEEALQYQKENGVIWTKVYEVMSGTEAEILEFMQGHYVEFFAQSLLQQEQMLTDWAKKIGIYNEDKVYNQHADYARKQIWDTEGIWSQGNLAQYRNVYDSLTAEQKANLRETHASTYASTMMETEDFNAASTAATQVVYDYLKQIKAAQDAQANQPSTTTPSTGSSSSSSTDTTHWTFTYNGTKYSHYKDKASAEKRLRELYQNDYSKAEMNNDLAGMTLSGQRYSKALGTLRSGLHSKGYSTGGLVDYTGTAIVHGSKSRPEAFLNAEQTAQIRDALKNSGKDNILDNIRTAVWQLKEHFASLTTKNNNEYNISIAPGAVVIQVEQLNDAYDIEELSNDVMNRMAVIAAKATNRGVNRR